MRLPRSAALLGALFVALGGCGPTVIAVALSGGGSSEGAEPPAAPTGLVATVQGPRQIDLGWSDESSDELGFRVERSESIGGPFEQLEQLFPDVTTFSDTTAVPSTSYVYRVTAFNGGGVSSSAVAGPVVTPATLLLAGIQPDSGLARGDDLVVVRGAGFRSRRANTEMSVRVGGESVNGLEILDGETITFRTPPRTTAGPSVLSVDNGYQSESLVDGFTYFASPPRLAPNDRRINAGLAGVAISADPEICCNGRQVYVVWEDTRNGRKDIVFNRSVDGGATWQPADARLDTDVPGAANSDDPEIACSGDAVYAVWSDSRNGASDIYINRSLDGGATWLPSDRRLDTDPAGLAASIDPELCCDGERIYVTWWDARNGLFDIYFNRSLDGGSTWLGQDVRLDTDAPGAAASGDPFIACHGDFVCVAWTEGRNGAWDIYFNRSVDGGLTWLSEDLRVDTDLPGAMNSANTEVCVAGSTIVVVWIDDRNGNSDVYMNRSTDGGVTWMTVDRRLDTDPAGQGVSSDQRLACSGDHMYVAWTDTRGANSDIYFNRSFDGGATWLLTDMRVDDDGADASQVRVAASGDQVYLCWQDSRSGSRDVYLDASEDGGTTWLAADQRLDTSPAGSSESQSPQLCISGARVYVAWRDARDGATTPGIYFNYRLPCNRGRRSCRESLTGVESESCDLHECALSHCVVRASLEWQGHLVRCAVRAGTWRTHLSGYRGGTPGTRSSGDRHRRAAVLLRRAKSHATELHVTHRLAGSLGADRLMRVARRRTRSRRPARSTLRPELAAPRSARTSGSGTTAAHDPGSIAPSDRSFRTAPASCSPYSG